jgi:hypothetical protein
VPDRFSSGCVPGFRAYPREVEARGDKRVRAARGSGATNMTEKDRYGETLRNREKAEEDRYAAEQDRIRLEKLRQQAQAAHGAKGLCPQCGAPLVKSLKFEVPVHSCGKCRGVWLAMDDLERILTRASEGEIVRFVRGLLS